MRIRNLLIAAAATILLGSCATPKKITYFQDLQPGETELAVTQPVEITIEPKDKINIVVSSQDQRLTNMFNLPYISQQIGSSSSTSSSSSSGGSSSSRGVMGYTVTTEGTIDFPVLGEIKVQGMTREQVGAYIKQELISRDLVKDPVVTVEFLNLAFSVLGEVNSPGRYSIDRDRLTVLDALSEAGDLTIYGNRENVMVLRQDGSTQRVYGVDLTSAENIYSSPVYYLQQGDVVYVEPNDTRKRQSTVNGTTVRSTAFWISIASFVVTVINLIVN